MQAFNFRTLYINSAYFIKFIGAFCILYYGTKFIIGVTVPGGYYSPFIARYLDYPGLLRFSLLQGTRLLAAIAGFDTFTVNSYVIRIVNGTGVRLVYSCLGYGLLSFWIAFIFANSGSWLKKAGWITAGCFFIWFINVVRITLVLISNYQQWKTPITMDHHTLFNIAVYIAIFCMIWLFNRSEKKSSARQPYFSETGEPHGTISH
ncbi:MAG: exosortase/archaeosortase family protein [Ferruginibacter sp.]